MDLRLQGKCAVITGASKGREIGCAVAEVLAEEGCDLVLVSRTQDTREAAVEENPRAASGCCRRSRSGYV